MAGDCEPIAFRVQPRASDATRGKLFVRCKHHPTGECTFPLAPAATPEDVWQWNGDTARPTLAPSINCRGGCGRHFSIIDGEVR